MSIELKVAPEWQKCFALLTDPAVSEIEANGPDRFFMKKNGKRSRVDIELPDNERYIEGIEVGLIPYVEQITPYDKSSYLFEGPLYYHVPTGEIIRGRCHIVLPPASDSAQVTIAKKSTSLITIDSIADRGSMSSEMLNLIKVAVRGRLNIVVSGGTGSGKTTMLEACTKLMPMTIRIGVAEDTPELHLIQENTTYLHSVPWKPGMNPNDVATLEWVVQQFQRMRTDMLIIGETRGKEFAQFLVAANSGMDGSMTTLHANDPKACLQKMTSFALKGSDRQPIRSINQDIATAVDLVIQLIILPDGRHKVSDIEEVTNTISDNADSAITTHKLYKYDPQKDVFIKKNQPTSALRNKLESRGIDISSLLTASVGSIMVPHVATGPRNEGIPNPNKRVLPGGLPMPSDRQL